MGHWRAKCDMNRTQTHLYQGKLMAAVACVAIAWLVITPGNVSAAGKPASSTAQKTVIGAGRLIVVRQANLGATIVGLKIDGVQTAQITPNRRYDAPLAAGSHVLTVFPVFSLEGARPTERRLTVEPGKTYTLAAAKQDAQVVLKK